jgi:hypothetical protein
MLRITELRLPLNHPEEALRAAIVARLGVASTALKNFSVFKRGYDARKKRRCCTPTPPTRASAPRPTPRITSSAMRRPISMRRSACAPSSSASGRAASLLH